MSGYRTADVAEMLGISPARIRAFVREGFIDPQRGPGGAFRFSFQDLVLIRTARELSEARIPPRRVLSALRYLRDTLPSGLPLSTVRIAAEGDRVVVRDKDTIWHPESGQSTFDFSVADLVAEVAPMVRRVADAAQDEVLDSADWFDLGVDLEAVAEPERAFAAYEQSLRVDPGNAGAHINLGRLLLERGQAVRAEQHFREAFRLDAGDATASYNLGVALEEQRRDDEALVCYKRALKLDAAFADAHYNLAMIYERQGNRAAALRHLSSYRSLTGKSAD